MFCDSRLPPPPPRMVVIEDREYKFLLGIAFNMIFHGIVPCDSSPFGRICLVHFSKHLGQSQIQLFGGNETNLEGFPLNCVLFGLVIHHSPSIHGCFNWTIPICVFMIANHGNHNCHPFETWLFLQFCGVFADFVSSSFRFLHQVTGLVSVHFANEMVPKLRAKSMSHVDFPLPHSGLYHSNI